MNNSIQDILNGRLSSGYTVPWALKAVPNDGWYINPNFPVVCEYGGTAVVYITKGSWPGRNPALMDTFEFFEWLDYAGENELELFGYECGFLSVKCQPDVIKKIRIEDEVSHGYMRVQMIMC